MPKHLPAGAKKAARKAAEQSTGIGSPYHDAPRMKVGDLVKIRYHTGVRGKIVELRGPLGPGGAQIYRVMLRRKQPQEYVEVREDQLIAADSDS